MSLLVQDPVHNYDFIYSQVKNKVGLRLLDKVLKSRSSLEDLSSKF